VCQILSESPSFIEDITKENIVVSFFLDTLYLLYMYMYFYLYRLYFCAGVLFLNLLVASGHSHNGITGALIE